MVPRRFIYSYWSQVCVTAFCERTKRRSPTSARVEHCCLPACQVRPQLPARTTGTPVPATCSERKSTRSASCHSPRSHATPRTVADLPYTEYSPAVAKRSWWSGSLFGALAFIGACGVLSVASSQHAAVQASADRLEALTQTLALLHPGGLLPAASPSAHKFALTGVTPTDFQMSRGDCWLFATVGLLEDSYRRYGVARAGHLTPALAPDR